MVTYMLNKAGKVENILMGLIGETSTPPSKLERIFNMLLLGPKPHCN